jgi:predicted ATPase
VDSFTLLLFALLVLFAEEDHEGTEAPPSDGRFDHIGTEAMALSRYSPSALRPIVDPPVRGLSPRLLETALRWMAEAARASAVAPNIAPQAARLQFAVLPAWPN